MKEIRIDVGVCTMLTLNLADIDFTGIKEIVFTVKNKPSVEAPIIIERTFPAAGVYDIKITPEESVKLTQGAEYDFSKVLTDGTQLKMTDNGKVILRKSVGGCLD